MEAFSNLVEHKIVKTSIFTNLFQYVPRKIKLFYKEKKNRLKSKSWTILSQIYKPLQFDKWLSRYFRVCDFKHLIE